MREIQRVGPYLEIVDARSPENCNSVFKVGLKQATFDQLVKTGQNATCAQFYGLIRPGLLDAVHAYRGLKRPLMRADDMHGDANVIAYTWRPKCNYLWGGSPTNGRLVSKTPDAGVVFVVLVHVFENPDHYPDHGSVWGSIDHWSWVNGDPLVPFAPIDWQERYEECLWSRKI